MRGKFLFIVWHAIVPCSPSCRILRRSCFSFAVPRFENHKDDQFFNQVKSRLSQLEDEDGESLQKMQDLSQQDYIHRIEQLKAELVSAWKQDLRVRALKIVIQVRPVLSR